MGSRARPRGYRGYVGYLDADAVSAFPTLWGTSWDTVYSNTRKHMYIQSLTKEVPLTLRVTNGFPSRRVASASTGRNRLIPACAN